MTQPGETDNYSVASHVNALITHANGKKLSMLFWLMTACRIIFQKDMQRAALYLLD